MSVSHAALLFVAAAILSGLAVGLVRRLLPRLNLVDVPNERSMHSKPIPRGGGLAIAGVCALGLVAAAGSGISVPPIGGVGYLVGVLVVGAVSAVDDARSLSVGVRLTAQAVGAAILVVALFSGPSALALGPRGAGVLLLALALVWIVGLTNAFNFMDGIDGLVGTQAVVAGVMWAILASVNGQAWPATLSILVAGACLGFLAFNWPPARIFMGDVGSAFLGLTFAFLALAVPRHPIQVIAAAVLIWPLAFDASVTLARRLLRRENVFAAHRSHLYQRMVLAGWRPANITLLYGTLTVLAGLVALLLWTADSFPVRVVGGLVVVAESVALLWLAQKAERAVG